MMKITALLLGLLMVVGSVPVALADDDDDNGQTFAARLSGYNEVHFIAAPTPALRGAVSTAAGGLFTASIDTHANVIQYELSYAGLEGTVTQAHIHFGQPFTVGGIVVWLCQTASTPAPAAVAALTPTCPAPGGTVTGTITAAQVLAVTGQGIEANPGIAPPPQTELSRLRFLGQEVTDLAEVALARPAWSVIVGREVNIVSLHLSQHAIHAQKLELL